jgi:hypothetical protein
MGKRVPNLVYQFDNEKGSEFRVQLEVTLPDEVEAARVKEDVLKGTKDSLKRAKSVVVKRIARGATPKFREIVGGAFDENIKRAKKKR